MSRLPRSRRARWLLTTGGAVVVAALILLWPGGPYARSQAQKALRRGDAAADSSHALVWYRVAAALAPHNVLALDKLAQADLETNRPKSALTAANRALSHGGGAAADILKSEALLELNQTDAAVTAAQAAVQSSTNNQAAQLQLGLCYVVASDNRRLGEIIALLGSSQAADTLTAVQRNHFAMAQELYVLGLLNSSARVLAKYPTENSEYYLLKARLALQLGQGKKSDLEQGRDLLLKGIALSPERVDLRQLLQSLDQKLGDTAAANEQGSKIQALESGKV